MTLLGNSHSLFASVCRRFPTSRSAPGSLFALGPHGALAQGITNPTGGGVIPVSFLTFLGLPLLAYVVFAAVARSSSDKIPAKTTGITLVSLYLVSGFIVKDGLIRFFGRIAAREGLKWSFPLLAFFMRLAPPTVCGIRLR